MSDLLPLVRKEADLVGRFVDVLNQEREALQAADASALPALVAAKSVLVDELNATAAERNQFLAQAGLPKDKAGMKAWLERKPIEKGLGQTWHELLEKAATARSLHLQNSQLLALHLRFTDDALAVLQQKMQNSLLYGPDGQSTSLAGNHVIDSA